MSSSIKCTITFLGLIIFIFLSSLPGESVNKSEKRLQDITENNQLDILLKQVEEYRNKNPQIALQKGQQALELFPRSSNDKLKIDLLNRLSLIAISIGEFSTSEKYARQSLVTAQHANYKRGEADALYNLGQAKMSQGQYIEAKNYYHKTVDIYQIFNEKKGLANAYKLISNIYFRLGDFSLALEYAFKAQELYTNQKDKKGIADIKNLCGIISSASGDYQLGLTYLKEANRRYENIGDKVGLARSYNNIGFTYSYLNKPSEALKYYKKSLQISEEMASNSLLATVLSSIGETYALLKDYQKASTFFNRSLHLAKILDDSNGTAYNLIQIGKIQRKLKQNRVARRTLEKALKIAKAINIKNEIKSANHELSTIFEIDGDYRNAVYHYKEYMKADEAIYLEKNRKKVIETKALYEPERNEKKLMLLKKDQQLQQLELAQQENFRVSYLIAILLMLFLALSIYTGYHIKAKATKILSIEIDKHKQTAKRLKESEEKFRILTEKAMVGICIIQDDTIQYANPAFLAIFGYSQVEIQGSNFNRLIHQKDRNKIDLLDIPSPCREFKGITKSGRVLHLQSFRVQTDYRGREAIMETVIDISQRKKIETELQKMRKLESMGILAGNIAHGFQENFSRITELVKKLLIEIEQNSLLNSLVKKLKNTSIKGTQLAQKLITFSEGGMAIHHKINFSDILKRAFATYPQLQQLSYEISISPDLMSIYGDEGELSQVVASLLWNAWEANTGQDLPTISIKAKNLSLSSAADAPLKPGQYVQILVSDKGKGIPPEQLEKVFDPYFSTKDTYHQKGMGLGLAICYSIVKKHNGYIYIKSQENVGTTVELLLPAF